MSGWIMLAAAAALLAAARRSGRRDPLAGRVRCPRPSSLARLAAIGRPVARAVPARLLPGADPVLVARARCGLLPGDVAAARAGSLSAFTALGAVVWASLGGVVGGVALVGLAGFGWVYPDAVMRSAAARRVARLERSAPALLDLVAAGVEAGVPLDAAVAGAARACGGELAEEVERSRGAIALGRARGEEMRDLGLRTGAPALAALALAVRLSDELGVPLADTLRDQADRSRAEAVRAVRERAARAGPRVLLVVVFLLVPAALLPVVAAAALTVAGALHS